MTVNPDVALVVTLFAVVAVAMFRLGKGWRPGVVDAIYLVGLLLVVRAVLG